MALRLRALELADRDGTVGKDITVLAEKYLTFLRGTLTDEQLNETPKRSHGDVAIRKRNEVLQQPLTMLAFDPLLIAKLAQHGIQTIGTLAQWHGHQLREHAKLNPAELEAITVALAPFGLRTGLDAGRLNNWVLHGTTYA